MKSQTEREESDSHFQKQGSNHKSRFSRLRLPLRKQIIFAAFGYFILIFTSFIWAPPLFDHSLTAIPEM